MLIGVAIYVGLVFFTYFQFVGDPFSVMSSGWVAYVLPVIPVLLRMPLFTVFPGVMGRDISEEERDSESGRVITLTSAGFSFSALFALLVTQPSFAKDSINIQIAIYYIVISVFAFVSSFSMESYKHKRWQQQLSILFEDIGRISILLTLMALMYVSSLDRGLVYGVGYVFIVGWFIDCTHRIVIWHEFYAAEKRYL